MATFTIVIDGLRTTTVDEFTNVIKRVEWTLVGTQDGQTFELAQKTEMGPVYPESFIPLENITDPSVVIAWIEAAEPALDAYKAHIQSVLNHMIAEAATVVTPMPWAPQAP